MLAWEENQEKPWLINRGTSILCMTSHIRHWIPQIIRHGWIVEQRKRKRIRLQVKGYQGFW